MGIITFTNFDYLQKSKEKHTHVSIITKYTVTNMFIRLLLKNITVKAGYNRTVQGDVHGNSNISLLTSTCLITIRPQQMKMIRSDLHVKIYLIPKYLCSSCSKGDNFCSKVFKTTELQKKKIL